ncbi:unnamed protein product, partial [Ixodes hexagonus]
QLSLDVEKGVQLGLTIRGGLEYGLGVFVTGVDPGSAADLAGLQVGDQIVSVNGQELSMATHDDAADILKHSTHMALEVRRHGKLPCDAIPPGDYDSDRSVSEQGIQLDGSDVTNEPHSEVSRQASDGEDEEAVPDHSFHAAAVRSRDGSEVSVAASVHGHGSVAESAPRRESTAENGHRNVDSETSTETDPVNLAPAFVTQHLNEDSQRREFSHIPTVSKECPGQRGGQESSVTLRRSVVAETQRRRRRQRPAVEGRIRLDLVAPSTGSVSHAASGVDDEKASRNSASRRARLPGPPLLEAAPRTGAHGRSRQRTRLAGRVGPVAAARAH